MKKKNKKKNPDKIGLNEEIIRYISQTKNEPKWMLKKRLEAYKVFQEIKNPKWGPNLNFLNFNDYKYYLKNNYSTNVKNWKDVPQKIRNTFKKLKITEAEGKFLSGVNNQYDSEVVYNKIQKELKEQNVIFCSMDKALENYPKLVKKYFGKLIPANDNKYAALNTAVWSGGSFIYVPKNVQLKKPLQAYFRINTRNIGQFERTLIIVEDYANLSYIEGCTAPIYDTNNLHAAVVEVFINKNAVCQYTTIQNWSDNVFNLVTKRAICQENSIMKWVGGNFGAKINMKYPCTILNGPYAQAVCLSVSLAKQKIIHDTGAKMFHLAPYTKSNIVTKSLVYNNGEANYRGQVKINKMANHSQATVTCDTLLLDKNAKSKTFPLEIIENNTSHIKHEAKITKLDKEKLFYLNTKGLTNTQAKNFFSLGFIEPFTKQLPMEYAVELNRLLAEESK